MYFSCVSRLNTQNAFIPFSQESLLYLHQNETTQHWTLDEQKKVENEIKAQGAMHVR